MKNIILPFAASLAAIGLAMGASDKSPIEHPVLVLRISGGESSLDESKGDVAISETRRDTLEGEDGEAFGIGLDIGRFRWLGALVVASYHQWPFDQPNLGSGRDLHYTTLSLGPSVRLVERPSFRLYTAATFAIVTDWGGLPGFRIEKSSEEDVSFHLGADFAFGTKKRWGLNVEARRTGSTLVYDSSPNEDFVGDHVELDINPLDITVGAIFRFR